LYFSNLNGDILICIIYLIFFAAVSAVIVLYFWLKSKKSTDNEGNLHKLKSAEQHLNNRLSECKKNIEDYKSEIFELRNNIKSLKIKSDELTRINISLEEEIEHLNKKQNRIEELQKQKEEFFAIYVHDLKNPTSTIQN
jgi:septal ring factor EnvC (AmiA/AmiB activator)